MRTVVHWDGDSFFSSIEQAADRRLRGRPVAVGGAQRGVVLSASREARRLGVRPGWTTARARRAIPQLVVIPAQFELYEQFFDDILGLCRETTPLVEPAAVGAAWLDLTGTGALTQKEPAAIVRHLRITVQNWLRVSLSTGIASNKLVARVAARARKPAAQIVVPPGAERSFLAPLPLAWLPGLAAADRSALELAGLTSLGRFAAAPTDALASLLGRRALPLQRAAQGVNEEPVGRIRVREEGFDEKLEFAEDAWEEEILLAHLRKMLERVMAQVRQAGAEVRQLTLRLRYTDREESQRAVTLDSPTALESGFDVRLPSLLASAWQRRVRLRALSLRASRVYPPSPQLNLFASLADSESNRKLAGAIDALRLRHGAAIVRHAWERPAAAGR
jgi:DNA polymerase-4